jgi:flagellar protein FliO/FliZ
MRLALILLCCLATPAFAAEMVEGPSLLGSALKMVAALAVIIGLLLLFYALSRKGFGIFPKQKGGLIRVLETRPLGGRKFLCVVRVRGEELLLGLSNDRIECLSKLQPGDDFATALGQVEEDRS